MESYNLKNIDIYTHLEKANTRKYLYHLTSKYTRNGIEKFGLNTSKNKYKKDKESQVFAHNTNQFSKEWYWYCLDLYMYGSSYFDEYLYHLLNDRAETRFFVNQYYDIWRIDNEIANKDWYIDFVGLHDNPHKQKDYYVKCFGNIEPDALQLCALDIDVEEHFINKDNCWQLTYHNPIIPRHEFIAKHGITPEEEVPLEITNKKYLEIMPENKNDILFWKKLNRMNFSMQNAA